jgi:elongation factor Ts
VFIKNQETRVKDLVAAKIAAFGENIVVRRFVRYELGE